MSSPITDYERPFLDDLDVEAQAQLIADLRTLGYRNESLAIPGWLVAKAQGLPDETSPPTRAKYRKILGELTDYRATPPKRRRRQAGFITAGTAAGASSVAAVASLSPGAAVALAVGLTLRNVHSRR